MKEIRWAICILLLTVDSVCAPNTHYTTQTFVCTRYYGKTLSEEEYGDDNMVC